MNRNPLTEEQRELIEEHIPFCLYWFKTYHIYSDDMQQNMLENLCKYVHLYKPEITEFTTFINVVFRSARNRQIRHQNTFKGTCEKLGISMDDLVYNNDKEPLTWEDILGYSEAGFDAFESNSLYKYLLERLENEKNISKKEFEMFIAYLTTGSQTQVAGMFNVSRQRISQVIIKIRNIIKKKKWLVEG